MSSKPGVPFFSVDCIPRGKPWGLGRYGAECLGAGTTLPRAFDHGQIQALQPVEFRFAGKCLSRVCRSVPLEPVRPGGEVGSGGYKAGGILLAFELGFVKVFVGAVFFCHQFVVGACFNDFAVV